MKDEAKTKKQLVSELAVLRQQVAELSDQRSDAGAHSAGLQEAEGFYRDILEGVICGVWVTDRDDVIFYANRGMEVISGLNRQQLTGVEVLTGFPEETLEFFRPHYQKARETLQPVYYDAVPVVTPTGRQSYQSGWLIPRTKDGRFDGMICAVEDITERRQAEEELRKHREELEELVQERTAALAHERDLLDALLDNIPDPIYFKDRESRFLRNSTAHLRLLGADDQSNAVGKTDFDFFAPDHAAAAYADEQRIIETGEPMVSKLERVRRWDGVFRWMTATKVPLYDREGQVTGTVGITRDVDEQVRLQAERDEQRRMLQAVLDAVPEFIVFKDKDSAFQLSNRSYLDFLGVSVEEAIGKTDFDFYPPENALIFRDAEVRAMETGETVTNECPVPGPAGVRWVETVNVPMRDADGEIIGVLSVGRDITERREMEEELRRSEEQYRLTIDALKDPIHVVDRGLRIVLYNTTLVEWARRFGLDTEIAGRPLFEVCSFLPDTVRGEYERVFETGETLLTTESNKIDSATLISETRKIPIVQDGNVIQVITVMRDITEQCRVEEALAEERNLLRTLIDALPDNIYAKDLEGRLMLINRAQARNLMGLDDPEEGIGMRDSEFMPPDMVDIYRRNDLAVIESGEPLYVEEPVLHLDGQRSWVWSVKAPLRDPNGDVTGLVGMSRDITERKRAEESLRHRLELEAALAHISRHFADPEHADLDDVMRILGEATGVNRTYICQLRDEGRKMDNTYEWCAPGTEPQIGNLQGVDVAIFPWWMDELERGNTIVVSDVGALPEEATAEREGLQAQDIRAVLVLPVSSSSGSLLGFIGFDDTKACREWSGEDSRTLEIVAGMLGVHWDRLRADEALRESEDLMRRVINTVPAYVVVKDRDGNFVQANLGAAAHYSTTAEDMIGRNEIEYVGIAGASEEEIRGFLAADREVIDAKRPKFIPEVLSTTPDGTQKWAQVVKAPLAVQGNPDCVLVVAFDITERKLLEERLLQSQKMEAVGTLAGGVAHDFNNLLTAIIGYSELVLQQLDPLSPQYGDVGQIKRAADRAADLTRQLLAFSRRQMLQPEVLDLNAVVSNIMRMLERLVGEDIDLATRLDPKLGQMKVDPGQIEQVIMNLIVNAREAMPQGGSLTIETRNVELDEAYAREHAEVRAGPYALLAVSDTGEGMDEETVARIFEPFFTTKEMGTGLGLSTVYGIVKQSGGHLSVYSAPGVGTTFKVHLPLVEYERTDSSAGAAVPDTGGSETILLVEDDESVRELARRSLRKSGYTVLDARDGVEALRICQEWEGVPHLLVTDVVMPGGMSGRQLAERVVSLYPEMKVLYMSGYTSDAILRHGVLDSSIPFLEKPFTPVSLAHKVREVLDG
jgi:two-component system cell cycle sensor histidine kinase/response regulator CckA